MINKTSSFASSLFVILVTFFLISSCSDKPNDLGLDLLPGSDNFSLHVDSSTTLTAENVFTDSVASHQIYPDGYGSWYENYSKKLIGDYHDALFGRTSPELALTFATYDTFPSGNLHADSLILYLKVDSILFGSASDVQKFTIYELNQKLFIDSAYYTSLNPSDFKGQVVGEGTFTPSADSIRFVIDNAAYSLKNKLIGATPEQMKNDSLFNEFFKGLYITSQSQSATGGVIVQVDPVSSVSRLVLYYNDSLKAGYYVPSLLSGVNAVPHDYSTSAMQADNQHLFIQGMAGPYNVIHLNINNWRDSLNTAAINKAELILTPDNNFLTSYNITTGQYPQSLSLYVRMTDTTTGKFYYSKLRDDSQFGQPYFGGTYNNGSYVFNIASYIVDFMRGRLESTDLVLYDRERFTDASRVAFDKNKGLGLKIIYTKLKN